MPVSGNIWSVQGVGLGSFAHMHIHIHIHIHVHTLQHAQCNFFLINKSWGVFLTRHIWMGDKGNSSA